jgi:peptidoglycan/LPS O-acetylase OafA/YrhL
MEKNDRNNWWVGLALVLIGLVFLVQNFVGLSFGNWWAIFILLPAIWAFFRAWSFYQEDHTITRRVANAVYGGLFPFLVGMIFLFNLDWGKLWPLFLIILGVGAIFGLSSKDKGEPSSPQ